MAQLRRQLIWAFLLGCLSWPLLIFIWGHSARGGLADKLWGGLFSATYVLGHGMAHIIFPNEASRHTVRYYIGPFLGSSAQILLLMAIWLAGIRLIMRRTRFPLRFSRRS